MADLINIPWSDILWYALPMIIILAGAVITLGVSAFGRVNMHSSRFVALISLLTIVMAFFITWNHLSEGGRVVTTMLNLNRFTFIIWLFILLSSSLCVLLSIAYLPEGQNIQMEYYSLILLSVFGMGILSSASNILTLIIGIETTALPIYAITQILRYKSSGNEAAIKYFITGAFALAFMIMGAAFVFGSAGSLSLAEINLKTAEITSQNLQWFFLFGCALFLTGMAFKVAAVPFHTWAPDVYDGAPTPVTAFIASALKIASFAALINLGLAIFGHMGSSWTIITYILAVTTMTIGNLAAIVQENIKRMLAYSSIAHAGYMLVFFPSLAKTGTVNITPVVFYLIAYAVMTIGAFAVIIALSEGGDEQNNISALAGLGKRRPGMSIALTLFLLSLAGFPPTIGFFAKYYLFASAVKSGFVWLVVIAMVNTAISVYYYLKPVMVIYLRDEKTITFSRPVHVLPKLSTSVVTVIVLCALLVIFFGIFPTHLLSLILHSV